MAASDKRNIEMNRQRNPRNPVSALFKKLTKLFSGPIVNYRRQTERNLNHRKLGKFGDKFLSLSGQSFKKSEYSVLDNLELSNIQAMIRSQRYVEFNQMEFDNDIGSALDVYADEMTTASDLSPLLNISCPNQTTKDLLHNFYYNILNIEHNLFGWCRTMCKYGDFFLYLDTDENNGVQSVINLPVDEVDRMEGLDATNPNYVQFIWNNGHMTFENWEILHFRILGNDKYAPLGQSVLDAARRVFRQKCMLEDAMISYRIVRAPERRVFYIDVGSIPPKEIEQFIQKVKTSMQRTPIVDSTTGKIDMRANFGSIEEDFFIPTRAGSESRIETLPGGQYVGDIDDVKYFRDKLFSALKIPMEYLSRGEGADSEKGALAQKDLRFARTVQRLQRSVVSELEKAGMVHLYMLGFRNQDLLSFKLSLNNPSRIAELQELEFWRTKFDVASSAIEGFFSRRWIAKNLFNLDDSEFLRNQRELFYDRYIDAELKKIEESGEEGFGGEGGGGLGDEFGDEGDMGDLGDEGEEGSDEEETLLAAPAKRDDEPHLTPGAKGKWYTAVKDDRRDMGARKRNYKGKYSAETASATKRNLFKGSSGMTSMSKGIYERIYEIQDRANKIIDIDELESNYEKVQENEVLEETGDIKRLLEELEKLPTKDNEFHEDADGKQRPKLDLKEKKKVIVIKTKPKQIIGKKKK